MRWLISIFYLFFPNKGFQIKRPLKNDILMTSDIVGSGGESN